MIDLQGAQSNSRFRGIGRYALSLTKAVIQQAYPKHEVIVVLNGVMTETIEDIRVALAEFLPQSQIKVWQSITPTFALDTNNMWRREATEFIREDFIRQLNPDVVLITSLFEGWGDNTVLSIGAQCSLPTAVVFYDAIPYMQQSAYLDSNPLYKQFYLRQWRYLKNADVYFAISESSKKECEDYVGADPARVFNIRGATEANFKPIEITDVEKSAILGKFKITNSFVLYSGATDERKNHLRLIEAFSLLDVNVRKSVQLVFAGGMPQEHADNFMQYADFCGLTKDQLILTQRVTDDELVTLYNLCELFVFPSWHEGFGLPALEAMTCGAPVIAANTSSLPEVVGNEEALFNPFSVEDIANKIKRALTDHIFIKRLRQHSIHQAKNFSWQQTANLLLQGLERWHGANANVVKISEDSRTLLKNISKIDGVFTEDDLIAVSQAIAFNRAQDAFPRLLVDVSELEYRDAKTGIQRVVRSVLECLYAQRNNWEIVPVYTQVGQDGYFYATKTRSKLTGTVFFETQEKVQVNPQDIFLGLDLTHSVINQRSFIQRCRDIGAKVFFVVYDLLPIQQPQYFPDGLYELHGEWLKTLAISDGLICISRSVAKELEHWLDYSHVERKLPLKIGWFHLGADVGNSMPTKGYKQGYQDVLNSLQKRPTFLSVGTIEPRKGHMQTLAAFESLWKKGIDVNLVFVGKYGWNVNLLTQILNNHNELNKRLFWLEGISDEYLESVYAQSSCLIAASEGEGFGLPLIEAAQHHLPIIARDLPVFQEVAGKYATYFSGSSPDSISNTVIEWLELNKTGKLPQLEYMPWLTWKQATLQIVDAITNSRSEQWICEWKSSNSTKYFGSDTSFGTQVGERYGTYIKSTGEEGYLLFGPYLPLESGTYTINVIYAFESELVGFGAYVDVSIEKGATILGRQACSLEECELSIGLDLPYSVKDLEIRIWVSKGCKLLISDICIQKARITNDVCDFLK